MSGGRAIGNSMREENPYLYWISSMHFITYWVGSQMHIRHNDVLSISSTHVLMLFHNIIWHHPYIESLLDCDCVCMYNVGISSQRYTTTSTRHDLQLSWKPTWCIVEKLCWCVSICVVYYTEWKNIIFHISGKVHKSSGHTKLSVWHGSKGMQYIYMCSQGRRQYATAFTLTNTLWYL